MAAKRISQSAINWTAIAERVPENQKIFFNSLKGKSDGYLRRVLSNPESPPKLDFAAYKDKIAIPGLVESFQKQYEAFKVSYPTENVSPQVDAQRKEFAETIKNFKAESNKRIQDYNAQLAKWDDILPYEDMTLEDYKDSFPEVAYDPVNRPTFWPHMPEDQPGYVPPTAVQQEKH